jgi:hypothetical protein
MSTLPYGLDAGSFIKAPLQAVADCLVAWGNEERVHRRTRAQSSRIPPQEALELLKPRDFNPDRAIIMKGPGSWTAFFDNHRDQGMAVAELFILCQRLKTDSCFFLFNDDGSAQFYVNRFAEGVRSRQVLLYKESGWIFEQSGEPLEFEEVARYALPKKRDRLTPELLRKYGEALGINFWDPAAYGNEMFFLNWSNKPDDDVKPSLQKITQIFGQPKLIMDRYGIRLPPPPS